LQVEERHYNYKNIKTEQPSTFGGRLNDSP